jgi:hypothetical protein
MFFTRWEQNHIQLITGSLDSGYGHEFEKAFTTFDEDLANSSGHHRIVKYNLGGMNCLVRFEADAYFDECLSTTGLSQRSRSPTGNLTDTDNDISTNLRSLSLKSPGRGTGSMPNNGVRVIQSGRLVPPTSVIEIKSRSKKIKMKDVIPQLWFSQTKRLFVGYHREGIIEEEVTQYEMAAYFEAWETQHEDQLQKFVSLILRIREAVQETAGKKGVVIYSHNEEPRKLKIYQTDENGLMALLDVEKKCWNQELK